MNEKIGKFKESDVTYILSETKDDMYLDVETIAEVFNTSRRNISKHLGNLELSETFGTNSSKTQITVYSTNGRPKKLYNLDVVIEIGHKVKSPLVEEFLDWADNILERNNLELMEDNPENFVVVDLGNDIVCVHDNIAGKNYFTNAAIAEISGLSETTVRDHWAYFMSFQNKGTNSTVNLNVSYSDKPVEFKDFDFVTYVVYRSNKPEAVKMRNYISKALDEKFNKDNGFTQPVKSLKDEAIAVINILQSKVWENTKLAFESDNTEDFIHFMDLADKYAMDSHKRRLQLKNELNCKNRLMNDLRMNRQGLLTESGESNVFIYDSQTKLIDF